MTHAHPTSVTPGHTRPSHDQLPNHEPCVGNLGHGRVLRRVVTGTRVVTGDLLDPRKGPESDIRRSPSSSTEDYVDRSLGQPSRPNHSLDLSSSSTTDYRLHPLPPSLPSSPGQVRTDQKCTSKNISTRRVRKVYGVSPSGCTSVTVDSSNGGSPDLRFSRSDPRRKCQNHDLGGLVTRIPDRMVTSLDGRQLRGVLQTPYRR